MKRNLLSALVPAAALFLAGCSFNVGYNPSYINQAPTQLGIGGKGLVVIADSDASWTYSGSPTSFTGGGSTLNIPLGEINKQIALKVFGAAFHDGVDFRSSEGNSSGYRLIITPKINSFTYSYNQLKNLGFAITPIIDIQLRVVMRSPDGKSILDRTYGGGPTEGETYFASGQPAEKINQVLHQHLFKLMSDAAIDAKAALGQ
jgi:hypothetical protein